MVLATKRPRVSILPAEQLVSFAGIVCLGVFVQSATGFAGGLVMIPLMLHFGHGLPEAQTALLTATIPQNSLGVYRFRKSIEPGYMVLPIVLRVLFLPLGVWTLHIVEDFPKETVRQIVSGVVLGCVLLILTKPPKPREYVRWPWTLLAFSTSGYFAGLTGTGGPMMVIWVQSHDWSTQKIRSFLFVMYLLSIPPSLGLLYFAFGSERILTALCSAAVLLPLVLLVTQVGLRVGTWLGTHRLRMITMALLLLLGTVGLIGPLLR